MITQLSDWQLALIFCGLNTLVGYGALAEAMARWQAQVSALNTLTRCLRCYFQICYQWLARCSPDRCSTCWVISVRLSWVAGAMYSAIGHRLGRVAKMSGPCSGE